MNTFGRIFRVSLFGESHGPGIGVLIDGCPPGVSVSVDDLLTQIDRRRSGNKGTTPRKEHDIPEIISGVFNGLSTGSPIMVITRNSDKKPSDYDGIRDIPRPGHADMVSRMKFEGFADPRGGGHFSGRLSWGLVVAGTIARKVIDPINISADLIEAGGSRDVGMAVDEALKEGDSIGGLIECKGSGIPPGYGEPFFYPVESAISQAVFAIPGIKGIEFGSGFSSAGMKGSEHNDMIVNSEGKTDTNNAGGINGGITNGNELFMRIAVKPPSSIKKDQKTFDFKKGGISTLNVTGRHDACIALRMPVIIESAIAIALADLKLLDKGICR